LAYFTYDTIVEVYYGTHDAGILFHHFASIGVCGGVAYETYGGSAMVNGLFCAEMSGPCYIIRCAWKRQKLEHTWKFHVMVWVYSSLYILSRGIGYSINIYNIANALNIPFYIKAVFLPALYVSYGWLILISRMLWRTIPNWYSNPKEAEKMEWWLAGQRFLKKWAKDSPGFYISAFFLALFV
jgi:hypothetical protein